MRQFQFRFEPLIKIKQRDILQNQQHLQAVLELIKIEQEKRKAIEEEIGALEAKIREEQSNGNVYNDAAKNFYLESLYTLLTENQSKETDLKTKLMQTQEILSRFMHESKVIEKLKEKHYTLWLVKHKNEDNAESISRNAY